MEIKHHSKDKYLKSLMDETMYGKAMALNVIHKINCKLTFFVVKIIF